MQAIGFFKKALDSWHTVKRCEWQMNLMKPQVQPYSILLHLGPLFIHWDCSISLLRDNKLLLPHTLAPATSLPLCPRDPSLFQLSVQPSLARAAKIFMEPSSQATDSYTQHRAVPEA